MWGYCIGFLFCGWWHLCLAQSLQPQIANPRFATNNPTLTTIAIEKPFCLFDDLMTKGASYEVYLYVIVDSADRSRPSVADKSGQPLNTTFQQTNGGQSGPYKAATFSVPNCASPPKLADAADAAKASAILTQYLIRIGEGVACLYDPNFLGVCNPPLSQDTAYRFKYILVDKRAGVMKDEMAWSHPIRTKKLKQSSTIDTWPGRRSGTMVVITTILSVLALVLVLGFLAAWLLAVPTTEEMPTETRYVSQITQHAVPRLQETTEQETSPPSIH